MKQQEYVLKVKNREEFIADIGAMKAAVIELNEELTKTARLMERIGSRPLPRPTADEDN
ncbi:MAG: hypothetical protein PHI98_16875 [Eubacteriales bacterium]|nr:hypothetical protein [Eubacteriales bacterium]